MDLDDVDDETVIQDPNKRPSAQQSVPVDSFPVQVAVSEEPNTVSRVVPAQPVEAAVADGGNPETPPPQRMSTSAAEDASGAVQKATSTVSSSEPLGQLHKADDNSLVGQTYDRLPNV
ncbi:hypothetical protein BIW11_03680 [Tropilaelaps mercedesae]|uniref:Uncharacterized protein n=1 Tax=Tropilaelaps mercedesae TaxID=418985 RepID=A0A1V9XHE7_9ACAR|nr:hypothetical protein BIW11_03680 [Tropilaelaps mercedesae]